jgi:hypothetical protein
VSGFNIIEGDVTIRDGANAASVKAASTAAVAADKALVVAVSPNNSVAVNDNGGSLTVDNTNLDVALGTRVAEATFTARVGEVQASPTANTVLGRLKDLYDVIVARWNTLGQKTAANSAPVVMASDYAAQPPADRIVTVAITGAGQTAEIDVSGCGVVSTQITGTWVGTLVAEATINGTDWFSITGYLTGDAQTSVSQTTTNGQFRAVCAGFAKARLRASAWTSGTASTTGHATTASSVVRASVGQTAYSVLGNSTTTPLGAAGVFTGNAEVCISTMGIQINVFTDQDSAAKGLCVEQSMDGTNWDIVDHYTVLAGIGFSRTIQSTATYCRVVYTNGPTPQGVLRLQLVLVPMVEALPRALGHAGGLYVEPNEQPTFTVGVQDAPLGNNKSMLSLCLAAGSPRVVRLREIWIRNSQTSAVTGVVTLFELRRITGHSGGLSVAAVARDTDDVLPAAVTVRTSSTVAGEVVTVEQRWEWSSDEWGPGALDVEALQVTHQNLTPAFQKHDPQTKPPTIRAGEGYHIKCATNTTAGTFDIIFVFTVET